MTNRVAGLEKWQNQLKNCHLTTAYCLVLLFFHPSYLVHHFVILHLSFLLVGAVVSVGADQQSYSMLSLVTSGMGVATNSFVQVNHTAVLPAT